MPWFEPNSRKLNWKIVSKSFGVLFDSDSLMRIVYWERWWKFTVYFESKFSDCLLRNRTNHKKIYHFYNILQDKTALEIKILEFLNTKKIICSYSIASIFLKMTYWLVCIACYICSIKFSPLYKAYLLADINFSSFV